MRFESERESGMAKRAGADVGEISVCRVRGFVRSSGLIYRRFSTENCPCSSTLLCIAATGSRPQNGDESSHVFID